MTEETKAPAATERPSRPFGERSGGGDRPRFGGGGGGGRSGPGGPPREGGRKFFRRKKVCKFCVEKIEDINYKDYRMLGQFVAESGKIVPRRLTGVCAPHQHRLLRLLQRRKLRRRRRAGDESWPHSCRCQREAGSSLRSE